MTTPTTVLITGASSGIGAIYAQRFAARGHDLVLVARDESRLEKNAAQIRADFGVAVDILKADLTDPTELAAVETRLRDDDAITILINNAGVAVNGTFTDQSTDQLAQMVALNALAPLRLAHAIAPRLARAKTGAIVNIGSVVGLAPEFGMTVYGATKAFMQFLSQGLRVELDQQGVYVQAVLPAGTKTEIWDRAGADTSEMAPMMEVADLVDAALVGFDRREAVTIPPLSDDAAWQSFDTARQGVLGRLDQAVVAARYKD